MMIDATNGEIENRDPVLARILSILEGNITVNEMNQITLEFRNLEFGLWDIDSVRRSIAEYPPNGKEVLIANWYTPGPCPDMAQIDHVIIFGNGVSHIINTYTIFDDMYTNMFGHAPPLDGNKPGVLYWRPKHAD